MLNSRWKITCSRGFKACFCKASCWWNGRFPNKNVFRSKTRGNKAGKCSDGLTPVRPFLKTYVRTSGSAGAARRTGRWFIQGNYKTLILTQTSNREECQFLTNEIQVWVTAWPGNATFTKWVIIFLHLSWVTKSQSKTRRKPVDSSERMPAEVPHSWSSTINAFRFWSLLLCFPLCDFILKIWKLLIVLSKSKYLYRPQMFFFFFFLLHRLHGYWVGPGSKLTHFKGQVIAE